MAKKDKYFEKEIGPVILYRNDLDKIIDKIRSHNIRKLTIETDNEIFDIDTQFNLNDISNDIINILKISFYLEDTIYFKIDFWEWKIEIVSSRDDTIAIGLINWIEDYLKKKTRLLSKIIPPKWLQYIWGGSLIGIPSLVVILLSLKINFLSPSVIFGSSNILLPLFILGVYSCLYIILGYFISIFFIYFYSNIIYLKTTKREKPNFWQRNNDRIIVGILVSIPSVLIGFFLSLLVKK